MGRKRKALNITAVILLAISAVPWIYTLAVSVWSAVSGTTIGVFASARTAYGAEAFLYVWFIYLFIGLPLYIIDVLLTAAGIVLLIIANKKS
ncbi:MAG: hypothetical protein IJT87_01145 [Ruminiclostridium sp.]|nr:hypothetical protein [Ruminiclostridium sp.]